MKDVINGVIKPSYISRIGVKYWWLPRRLTPTFWSRCSALTEVCSLRALLLMITYTFPSSTLSWWYWVVPLHGLSTLNSYLVPSLCAHCSRWSRQLSPTPRLWSHPFHLSSTLHPHLILGPTRIFSMFYAMLALYLSYFFCFCHSLQHVLCIIDPWSVLC